MSTHEVSPQVPRRARRRARPSADVRTPELAHYVRAGGVLGFVLGGLLALFGPRTEISSPLQQVVLLGVIAAALGVLGASVVYLVVDWARHRPRW